METNFCTEFFFGVKKVTPLFLLPIYTLIPYLLLFKGVEPAFLILDWRFKQEKVRFTYDNEISS